MSEMTPFACRSNAPSGFAGDAVRYPPCLPLIIVALFSSGDRFDPKLQQRTSKQELLDRLCCPPCVVPTPICYELAVGPITSPIQ